MLDDVPDNAICSTEFQIIKPINPEYLYFLYGWLTNKENYDEIKVRVPKGAKGTIQTCAAADGLSVNAWINQAIDKQIEGEGNT